MKKTTAPDNPRMTPAQRHKMHKLAAKAAAAANPGETQTGNAYELALMQLTAHRRQLKKIQSTEGKETIKHKLVPQYDDYIAGVLEAGQGAQDEVLTTLLVWNIDIGKFDQALKIAKYALEHDLQLPDQYKRDVATLLLDEYSEACLKGKMALQDAATLLIAVSELTKDFDAPDQARAKLHKAIGLSLLTKLGDGDLTDETKADAESAEHHLKRALELHSGIGVKKQIESIERKLKKVQS